MDSHFYKLSPTDQAVPRIYTRKVYTFEFSDEEALQCKANAQVEQALAVLSEKWPFILDLVGPTDKSSSTSEATKKHMVLFDQRDDAPPHTTRTHLDIFQARDLRDAFDQSYEQLCDRDMPPSCILNEDLYPAPHIPKSDSVCPVFNLHANYIKGGLLLCFNFHHCVFDGTSCVKLIKELARIMRGDEAASAVSMLEADINHARQAFEAFYTTTSSPKPIDLFSEYAIKELQSAERKQGAFVTKRVITLCSTTVEQLKAIVNRAYGNEKGILSKQACLAAFIWVLVIRARAADLDPKGTAKLGIAVDIRPRLKNVIAPTFMGNAIVHTVAQVQVDKLAVARLHAKDCLFNKPQECVSTIQAMLTGALEVRNAVDRITEDSVRDRLHLFATSHDPSQLHNNYVKALDLPGYGLDFSSWKDQCADLDFGIQGATNKIPSYVRMTWSASEGALNILPRRGGSEGEADWEILLGLREEDWVSVIDDLALGGWTTKVVI